MSLLPAVPSLPQPTPIPLRPPTVSSRPPRLDMQWRHPTLRLQSRQRGLWSLPPMLPIRTTRRPLSMPTGSLSPRLPLSLRPPRRRTRCTRTRSVFFCFFDVFCLSLYLLWYWTKWFHVIYFGLLYSHLPKYHSHLNKIYLIISRTITAMVALQLWLPLKISSSTRLA